MGVDDAALEFWRWFAGVAATLGRDLDDKELLEELDARVGAVGVGWEVGPGRTRPNMLALSPGGDAEKLRVTQRIVALAPEIPGWEILAAKPPRDGGLELMIEIDGAMTAIDARGWRYVVYRYPDGKVELVVEVGPTPVTEAGRLTAATVVVDGLLGEGRRMLEVVGIEAVTTLDAELATRASPIATLADHLDSLDR